MVGSDKVAHSLSICVDVDRWERLRSSLAVVKREKQKEAQEVLAWCKTKKDEVRGHLSQKG